jgi:hypothetical protein
LIVGAPARAIRTLDEKAREMVLHGADVYVRRGQLYNGKRSKQDLQYDASGNVQRNTLIFFKFPTQTVQSIIGAMEKRRSKKFCAFSLFFNSLIRLYGSCDCPF